MALFLKAIISKENSIKKQAEKIANFNNKNLFSRFFLNKKKWFTLNVIGSKTDPVESIAEQIDETILDQWISRGIPPSLKTKTKKTVAGVIKSLNNLTQELKKKDLSPNELGKGRNVWYCIGMSIARDTARSVALRRATERAVSLAIDIPMQYQTFLPLPSSLGERSFFFNSWVKLFKLFITPATVFFVLVLSDGGIPLEIHWSNIVSSICSAILSTGSVFDPITFKVNHFFLFKKNRENKFLLLKFAIFSACFFIEFSFEIIALRNKANELLPVP